MDIRELVVKIDDDLLDLAETKSRLGSCKKVDEKTDLVAREIQDLKARIIAAEGRADGFKAEELKLEKTLLNIVAGRFKLYQEPPKTAADRLMEEFDREERASIGERESIRAFFSGVVDSLVKIMTGKSSAEKYEENLAKREEVQRKVDQLEAKKTLTKPEQKRLEKLEEQRDELSALIDGYKARVVRGINLERLGGQNITFRTADGAELPATYIDVSRFHETLERHGGKLGTLSSSGEMLQGIVFKSSVLRSKDHFFRVFREVEAFDKGWTLVQHGDSLLMVPKESAKKSTLLGQASPEGIYSLKENVELSLGEFQDSNPETVILSSSDSVGHEGDPRLFRCLAEGKNVFLFTHRSNTSDPSALSRDDAAALAVVEKKLPEDAWIVVPADIYKDDEKIAKELIASRSCRITKTKQWLSRHAHSLMREVRRITHSRVGI